MNISTEMVTFISIVMALGMIGAWSLTNTVKMRRKDYHQKPMLDIQIRIMGSLFAFLCTNIVWYIAEQLAGGTAYDWTLPFMLGVVAAILTPVAWQNSMKILRVLRPDWAERWSGQ